MRFTWRLIICLLSTSCAHIGARSDATNDAESELLRLETALNEGVLHRDRPALDRILAEEFGLSLPDRPAAPRDGWLYNVQRTITVSSYKITDPHISISGKVALVQTRQHFDDYKSGERVLPPDYVISDVWAYRSDRWQLVRRLSEVQQP